MTTPTGSAADELRARTGLDAVPAYDEIGRPTGLVAINPDAFCDWHDDLYEGGDD